MNENNPNESVQVKVLGLKILGQEKT